MTTQNLLQIDRSKPFDLVVVFNKGFRECFHQGWSIAEEDERSLALTEVDLSKVSFEMMLKTNEKLIGGEERLNRLKNAGYIRLDAQVFQVLWQNQGLIPESWKIDGGIFFDGTVVCDFYGDRYVLCLSWDDVEDKWCWHYFWLGEDWHTERLSACLTN